MNRANLVLFALVPCLAPLSLGAKSSEPDQNVLKEKDQAALSRKVERLAKQLGSDQYTLRETAERELLEIGEAAWPVLKKYLDDKDLERAHRVRKLAPRLAVVSRKERASQSSCISKLENQDDEMVRAEGLYGMLSLNLGGKRALKKHLSGKGSKPVLRIELGSKVIVEGEKIEVTCVLANKGTHALWLRSFGFPGRSSSSFQAPFGEIRPTVGAFGHRGRGGRRRLAIRGGYYNPIRGWKALLPGKEKASEPRTHDTRGIGIYLAKGHLSLPSVQTINPRFPGTTETVPLKIGDALTQDLRSQRTEEKVFVLPHLKAKNSDELLEMKIEPDSSGGKGSLKSWAVTFKLRNRFPDPVCVEKDLLRWAWYALLDAKGVPVKWGSLKSILPDPKSTGALASRFVKTGSAAAWLLKIPYPQKAGTYSLQTGYRVGEAAGPEFKQPVFDAKDDELEGKAKYYKEGKLFSRLQGLIMPPPK